MAVHLPDLGRLLRMRAMVLEAAQVEATYQAGEALVGAYLNLRDEMLRILEPDELVDLRAEFERLFPVMKEPPPFSHVLSSSTGSKLAVAAHEAQLQLRKMQGWIQGLIDEMTLEERLRLEAEAKARLAARPPTGFAPTDQT